MKRKLITSALPYVNNQPHLGNIVGCVLSADVYSRYCKHRGQEVIYICGTDEYGTATEIKAMEEGVHPKDICDRNSAYHKKVYDWFGINFDYFGRTAVEEHTQMVQKMFKKLFENGYFEEKESEQFFCEKCEFFLADRYVIGNCSKCGSDKARGDQCDTCGCLINSLELVDPKCSICISTPKIKQTKHFYLRLDALKPKIENFINERSEKWSENAKEISNSWINKDLYARCMTRDLKYKWGVPVPMEGFESKVFYVWFDAPIGYFTFAKCYLGDDYEKWIKGDGCKFYQFMGKDNVPFHSIIFPGILLGQNEDYTLVSVINSTEYLMFENNKFSKSRNHGIFGSDLLTGKYGNHSIWRYYLMKIRPESKDSNFSFEDFKNSITSDLLNNFGNLCNRVLKYLNSRCEGVTKETIIREEEKLLISKIKTLYFQYLEEMESINLRNGIKIFLEMSKLGNEYLQKAFSSNDYREIRDGVFSFALNIIILLGHIIVPFMPEIADRVFEMSNIKPEKFPSDFNIMKSGHKISSNIKPLFDPFTKEQLEILKR
ncbi:putative methionine--tRNA ligase, cytoplasmic [Astathelohania contejeani]|uniref:methionine--tRNA ligase n=1 Tax=Astathelohania contejeani TaxID=164912 RepID=A0ABQ7HZZ6_9MICR|nr:putative methionine--tRNA ligase, cytoplasmic [Thelohania contejeani]